MRLRLLAPALTFATLAVPAYAQDFDAAAAVEKFLTDAAPLGATEATVGEVSEEDGTVTATDVAMRWTTSFDTDGATATVNAEVTMPTVDVSGLEETDDGYSADELAIPTIHLSIEVTGAEKPLSYDLTLSDYTLKGASWQSFPTIEANPAAPVSRFAPLVAWAVGQSYALNSIGGISGTVVAGEDRQQLDYGPFSLGPVENGTLAEFNYGELTIKQTADLPDGEGGTKPGEVTITYGPITGRNLDAKPLAALLTGIDAGDGPAEVAGNVTIDKVTVDAGGAYDFSIGNIVIDNFTIDPARGPLMPKLDDLVISAMKGEEPDPLSTINLALDLYGAYGFGLYSFRDLAVKAPDVDLSVGDIRSEGLSAEGLDRVAVENVSVSTPGGSGSLGTFEFGGITFPAREAVLDFIMQSMSGAEPTPQAVMAVLPTLGNLAVRALNVDAGPDGPVALDDFSLNLGGYIGAIPTEIAIALKGLVMPAALLPDPNTAMMAQMVGADPVRADGTVRLAWDEDTQRVELNENIDIGSIGRLQTDATLSGIPQVVFQDPQRIQEAVATAAVNGVMIHFEDAGITKFLLDMVAQQSGVPADQFIEGIAQQAEMQLAGITGDQAFAGNVAGAVRTYLTDPKSLTLSAAPANPVAVAQIMGAAMTAPAALPGLLNFSISANGQ